ncbi:MAG: hypothetical protein NZ899_06865 [Thermoguttaceae bacterium]|nr:hypothetical protein [Thermoguttaceae bacterium]MDW8078511.1 hypothetical protein [Thermoguttaceae bacterium]
MLSTNCVEPSVKAYGQKDGVWPEHLAERLSSLWVCTWLAQSRILVAADCLCPANRAKVCGGPVLRVDVDVSGLTNGFMIPWDRSYSLAQKPSGRLWEQVENCS